MMEMYPMQSQTLKNGHLSPPFRLEGFQHPPFPHWCVFSPFCSEVCFHFQGPLRNRKTGKGQQKGVLRPQMEPN